MNGPMLIVGTVAIAQTFWDRGDAHDLVKELGDEPIMVKVGDAERDGLDQRGAHRAIEELWKAANS